MFLVQGLQLLLDGVLNYLPCPTESSNYALVQSKEEEKVPNSKKQLNEIIWIAWEKINPSLCYL